MITGPQSERAGNCTRMQLMILTNPGPLLSSKMLPRNWDKKMYINPGVFVHTPSAAIPGPEVSTHIHTADDERVNFA